LRAAGWSLGIGFRSVYKAENQPIANGIRLVIRVKLLH